MKTKRWMTGWIAILLLCTFLLPAQAVEAAGKHRDGYLSKRRLPGVICYRNRRKKAGVPCAFKRDDSAALCG